MTAGTQHRKLTYEDFPDFPEDGRRHELIDGEHVAEPSPNTIHQRIVSNLHFILSTFVRNEALRLHVQGLLEDGDPIPQAHAVAEYVVVP